MSTRTLAITALVLTAAALAASAILYPSLPERMPIHWNIKGQVDGWGEKRWAAFLDPLIMLGVMGLLLLLPLVAPKNFKIEPFRATFNQIVFLVVVLGAYTHVITLAAALRPDVDKSRALIGGLFVFFALFGNLLGRVRRNFWVGVRTPWTLANDTVWIATHRFAARFFVVMGIVGAAATWLGTPPVALFVGLMGAVLVPVLYSLVLYKKLERHGEG